MSAWKNALRGAASLAVALAALAAPVLANTYWVAPTVAEGGVGVAGQSGSDTTAGQATTLAWFNENAVAGDVCRFKSGAYGTGIFPRNSGTSSSRIRYYGFPQDPGAVRVLNIQFGGYSSEWYYLGNYCTARWIRTTSAFSGFPIASYVSAVGDSIVACWSSAANNFGVSGKYNVADSLVLSGTSSGGGTWVNIGGRYDCNIGSTSTMCSVTKFVTHYEPGISNRITNSTFTMVRSPGTGDYKGFQWVAAESTVFFGNTINFTTSDSQRALLLLALYNCDYNLVQGNTWNITMNATPTGASGVWMQRDWSVHNRFLSNVVTVSGVGGLSLRLADVGSVGETVTDSYYGYNTIKVENPTPGVGVWHLQNGTRRDTLEYNTIATSSTAKLVTFVEGTDNDGSVFRHNSFMTAGPTAVDMSGGTGSHFLSTRLAANVYYCQTANSATTPNIIVNPDVDIESAGVFFSLGSPSASYAIKRGGEVGVPGSGSGFGGTQSRWCSPAYFDSSYGTFDGRVTAAGCGVGPEWDDGYVGIGKTGDATLPVVAVTSPTDTSYVWTPEETMNLVWTASDNVGVTSISIDVASAFTPPRWTNVVSGLAGGTTTYPLVLHTFLLRRALVRVRAFDAAGNIGEDDQVFLVNTSGGEREGFMDIP